ncbi:MAG: helix-turn-helix domain-containing protein [Tildeniella nuda ZEHNDER 1965/U140]|nr:helix-turn-helix domain-containing protein [Tildeniella nuda ZEHNDER 1965/U140]
MADKLKDRPFDNFKAAVTDPPHFFGRNKLIEEVQQFPFRIRVLLGGKRIGKTSTLRALEWNLLEPAPNKSRRAFPVFISLRYERPNSLDNLRYLMIDQLRNAIDRWQKTPGLVLREKYQQFLNQFESGEVTISFLTAINAKVKINNLGREHLLDKTDFQKALSKTIIDLQKWDFEGVCFLFDEAVYLVREGWANSALSYFRSIKDDDMELSPLFGLVLSGYRALKNYQQEVGSPLYGFADFPWLGALEDSEAKQLIIHRIQEQQFFLNDSVNTIMQWTGNHPYLTQQMLNSIFDIYQTNAKMNWEALFHKLIRQHDVDFSVWWNKNQQSDGFSDAERLVYEALIKNRRGTIKEMLKLVNLSESEVEDALVVLSGTGVIQRLDEECYSIGSLLFETWVKQQKK